MIIQLTDAGASLQAAATSPLVMTSFELGSSFNYVPTASQTSLQGATVYSNLPGLPVYDNQNMMKYPIYLGDSLGPITYGEIGLFYNSVLFAVCVFEIPVTKMPLDPVANTGGAVVVDMYVPLVSANYEMYANSTQANTYKASVLMSVAELPHPKTTTTNLFVIQNRPKPFLAYTTRVGEWVFDGWRSQGMRAVISSTMNTLVVPPVPDFYLTEGMIIQAMSGQDFGVCRQVKTLSTNGNGDTVIGLDTPLGRPLSSGTSVAVLSNIHEVFQGGSF